MPADQFDYNLAVAQSVNEQMLLNVVRMRYSEPPVFLAANSILTQYVYSGSVGVSGSGGASLGDPLWSVGGNANLLYIERPTITYAPLSGADFVAQLITPVPTELVFGLVEAGWPPDQLLTMTVLRINDVRSSAFAPAAPGELRETAASLDTVVGLLIELARREAIEVDRSAGSERFLVFKEAPDPETAQLIEKLKSAVGLASGCNRFRVTSRVLGRAPDELTLRVRSILELLGFLARGVDVPPEQTDRQLAIPLSQGSADQPLHVYSQLERPADAFVAVQHEGYWYFIRQSDHRSKQAFSLLVYLFQMQAPQVKGAGPVLTVPTG